MADNDFIFLILGMTAGFLAAAVVFYVIAAQFLRFIFPDDSDTADAYAGAGGLKQFLRPFAVYFKRHGSNDFVKQNVAAFSKRLQQAGDFWGGLDAYEILSAKLSLGIAGFVLILFLCMSAGLMPLLTLACSIMAGIMLYVYPSAALDSQAQDRQHKFMRQLPAALDILRVAAEAGLDLFSSINYLNRIYVPGPVKEEMELFQKDVTFGKSTAEALNSIAERIDMQEARSVFGSLAQSIEMGTSISEMLCVTTQEMRKKMSLHAQEEAQKATVKISFPLLLLILPGVFIVLLGPIVYKLTHSINM